MTALKTVQYSPKHYAVTVTLPSIARRLTAEAQLEKYKAPFLRAFGDCWKVSAVCELTTNYDIHFHAVCSVKLPYKVNQPMKRLKDIFRVHFGFTCIKEVINFDGWIDYMTKDLGSTQRDYDIYPVLVDDYGKLEDCDVIEANDLCDHISI